MSAKASVGLDEVVIHNAKYAKVLIVAGAVLGKGKVEARLQPVRVRPAGIINGIAGVPEPRWIWLRDKKLALGDNFDFGRHVSVGASV